MIAMSEAPGALAPARHFVNAIRDYVFWCPPAAASAFSSLEGEPRTRGAHPNDTRVSRLAATWIRRGLVRDVPTATGELELRWRPVAGCSPPGSMSESDRAVAVSGRLQLDRDAAQLRGVGLALDPPSPTFGAVLDLESGSGIFADRSGLAVLNGDPGGAALTLRLQNGPRQLSGERMRQGLHRARGELVLALRGQLDPKRPARFDIDARGQLHGARIREYLFLTDQAQSPPRGSGFRPRGELRRTEPTGYSDFQVRFTPTPGERVVSFTTHDAVFRFRDASGRDVGTLRADMVVGRAFPTRIAGLPLPVFRMGGLAPIREGTGLFSNTRGLVTVNSVFGVSPQFISSVFLLRLDDQGSSVHASRPLRDGFHLGTRP